MLRKLNGQHTLLKECMRPASSTSYTHMTMEQPGSPQYWHLDSSKVTEFWSEYCELSQQAIERPEEVFLCLYEATGVTGPVVVDINFIWSQDVEEDELWRPSLIPTLVRIYQTILAESVSDTKGVEHLYCAVLQSPLWSDERGKHIDLRLQFPYCRLDVSFLPVLRKRALEALRKLSVIALLTHTPVVDWDAIIPPRSGPLLMYGSRATYEQRPLIFERILIDLTRGEDEDSEDEDEDLDVLSMELEECFAPTNHSHSYANHTLTLPDMPVHEQWLPLFFSVDYWLSFLSLKGETKRTLTPRREVPVLGGQREHLLDDKLELAKTFLDMLDSSRFHRESSWLTIGKALSQASDASDDGLQLWIRYSRSHARVPLPPYHLTGDLDHLCALKYYTFPPEGITVKSLAWFAMTDSPEQYTTWHNAWCSEAMNTALSRRDSDMGHALYRMHWLEYVCVKASGVNQLWYRFDGTRWKRLEAQTYLRRQISGEFELRFKECRTTLSRLSENCTDPYQKERHEKTISAINALVERLGKGQVKNAILREAAERFLCETFEQHLDKNPLLLGTPRGVLEVLDDKIIYRRGMPEDFVTKSTGVPYLASYSWEHPSVKAALKWIGQIFVDKALRHHAIKFCSSILRGGNQDKLYIAFAGDTGNNAKSTFVKALVKALGTHYAVKLNTEALTTGARGGGDATPQWARTAGVRLVVVDEIEDDTPLKKGIIKKVTGGDTIPVRGLYQEFQDIEVLFKILQVCNDCPDIARADPAIRRRFRIFPCVSRFVPRSEAPESEDEQYRLKIFPEDLNFDRNFPELVPALLWVFVNYYHYYAEEGLVDPPMVTEYTSKFWDENDSYGQFLEERTIHVADQKCSLSLGALYSSFKEWFYQTYPNTAAPERRTFKQQITARWGRPGSGAKWLGVAFKDEEARE